ncbi:MAG TPA: helix-turn-helix transcriptional regulator [Pseudonocardiaceae bacterium]|nr:helix-turn-helix transcriptional regulator [Pseudonocardiaceae bacterium]
MHDIDPNPDDIDDRAYFGWALTIVRERAGLTVRDVAKTAGIPVATVGDYFAGRSLPPLKMAGVLPDILRACGVDSPDLLDSWKSALVRVRLSHSRRADATPAPYRGLSAYQSTHARWFFGRSRLISTLQQRCGTARAKGSPVAVVGASGVGKSSALFAGLVPAIQGQPGRRTVAISVGRNPCRSLADQLSLVLDQPADVVDHALHVRPSELGVLLREYAPIGPAGLTLVIDQLDELFAGEVSRASRNTFLAALAVLAGTGAAVVLGVRADRHSLLADHPLLRAALADSVHVGMPSDAELIDAIQGPARRARLCVEPDLVHRIVADAASISVDPLPGGAVVALPLVSHALLMTWRRRRGGVLTNADYLAVGGVRDAVRRCAELALASLNPEQQHLAARLFRKLVTVHPDGPHSAGPVPCTELDCAPGNPRRGQVEQVLGRFAAVGLVTLDAESAAITHDAVFAGWPRLADLVTPRRV